jgi:predicted nucleotidyltransferase
MTENTITISSINRIRTLLEDKAPEILKNYHVLFGYLYGSYARGYVHPFSDIDIGIYLDNIPAHQVLDIELSLALDIDEALGHIGNVDVRSITDLPLMMKGIIVTEGILIYSIDESVRVEFEVNVRKTFFDFKPVIKRYHKAYLARISNGA